ncbi:MAG: hypothetical protein ABJE10_18940, partial [bacterium]
MTTEHFVLQTAASATIAEAGARSTLYVMALSSTLIAMGFLSASHELFVLFGAIVLPVVYLLGMITVMRLVDTAIENMQYLTGIARIRSFYRTLGPEAAVQFSPESGRWPEAKAPSLFLGTLLAFMGTTAALIALVNSIVAGGAAAMLTGVIAAPEYRWIGLPLAICVALLSALAFFVYQRWRFEAFENAN